MSLSTRARELDTDPITARIIGGAIDIHRYLGPGLLEHTYEAFLEVAIRKRGLRVERQVAVPVEYLGVEVNCSYRIDLLVENTVVVEVKAAKELAPVHVSQVLTYLRLVGAPGGAAVQLQRGRAGGRRVEAGRPCSLRHARSGVLSFAALRRALLAGATFGTASARRRSEFSESSENSL